MYLFAALSFLFALPFCSAKHKSSIQQDLSNADTSILATGRPHRNGNQSLIVPLNRTPQPTNHFVTSANNKIPVLNEIKWVYISTQVGSLYSTLALSVERYLAVVHPFTKFRLVGSGFKKFWINHCMFRHQYSSKTFIIPVVLYSFFYNLPKFFELKLICYNPYDGLTQEF